MLHISISVFKINPWNVELGRLIAKAGSILDNPGGINFSQHNYVEFILEEKAHVPEVLLGSSGWKWLCSVIFAGLLPYTVA